MLFVSGYLFIAFPPLHTPKKKQEKLSGVVVVTSQGDLSHGGIMLTIEGSVNLQLSAKSVGMFEAFYNSLKPVQLIYAQFEVAPNGKLPSGTTEMPFEVPLKGKDGNPLYETYHGVFVNIQYSVRADMQRSFITGRNLQKTVEFIIENEVVQPLLIVTNHVHKITKARRQGRHGRGTL